jgi:hypothetical protein
MLLDIALGIIISIFVSKLLNIELTTLLVFVGIFFALLPDADFILFLLKGGKAGKRAHFHRDLFHRPLLYIPIGFIMLLPFGKEWAFLFALTSLGHFIHDSTAFGLGWGIRLFWPFSKNYFMFFRFRVGGEKKFPFRPVYNLNSSEALRMADEYGDPNWMRNLYFCPSVVLVTELVFLVLALLLLWLY